MFTCPCGPRSCNKGKVPLKRCHHCDHLVPTTREVLRLALYYFISLSPMFISNCTCKPYPKDLWRSPPYPEETYFYPDYKLPAKLMTNNKIHSPSPQNCPETGKTLCNEIDQYPLEQILDIVKSTNSINFNFSSIFSDESSNNQQPNLIELATTLRNSGVAKKNETRLLNKPKSTASSNNQNRQSIGSNSLPKQILEAWRNVNEDIQQVDGAGSPSIVDLTGGPTVNNSASWLGPGKSSSTQATSSTLNTTNQVSAKIAPNGTAAIATAIDNDVTNRIRRKLNPTEEETMENVCATKVMYIIPKAALNDRSEWKFIVNIDGRESRLKQIIKAEVCLQNGSQCSSTISLPFGYKTRCKQKYIKKKLLALDTNGQTTSIDNFFVPSCCACEIYRETKVT